MIHTIDNAGNVYLFADGEPVHYIPNNGWYDGGEYYATEQRTADELPRLLTREGYGGRIWLEVDGCPIAIRSVTRLPDQAPFIDAPPSVTREG